MHACRSTLEDPTAGAVAITSADFHDVDYHSGEPFDGTDWPAEISDTFVTWATSTFAQNANANALRFSTLYNFRFNADAPPGETIANIGLFKPAGTDGAPNSVNVAVLGPVPGGGGPANDSCAGAIDVELGSTAFTNVAASSGAPAFTCGNGGRDVWFRFTPTFTGRARISTCGAADFDSIIAVYQGCDCGTLGTALKCNNDGCGSAGTDAKVVVNVQAGACYLIRVGGIDQASGIGTLKIAALDADNAINADHIISGTNAGDRFGQNVAAAGDVDDDGVGDVLVSAHLDDESGGNAGGASAFFGSAFAVGIEVHGEDAGDTFGRVVAGGAGFDFDGDGHDDFLVGAPLNDENGADAGKVYCFSGADQSVLWVARGQNAGDRFGSALACVGDVNNNGVGDVLVGAPFNSVAGNNAGRAYLFSGNNGLLIHAFPGKPGEQFGAAVAGLGDVNDDDFDDVAIGGPRNSQTGANAGRVVIFSGATNAQVQALFGGAGDRFGSSLAGITLPVAGGSQTRTYLAIGAPDADAAGVNAGAVRLFMRIHQTPACPQWLCSMLTINGQAAGERLGASVALGDVLAGSAPEILAGAPASNANGQASGAVSIFNSANGTRLRRIYGEAPDDAFGTSVSAGDINGDLKADFIVGAPNNDAAAANAGRAYVFLSESAAAMQMNLAQPDAPDGGSDDDDTSVFIRATSSADIDGDGKVDANDLLAVIAACTTQSSGRADLNGDGRVDVRDVSLVIAALQR